MKRDDVYSLIEKLPKDISKAYFIDVPFINRRFNRIVIIGMGGSYIGGLVCKEFVRDEIKVPIEVCPGYVPVITDDTLTIFISYSGNSKEVLNSYHKIKSNHKLVITSGGHLLNLAKRNKNEIIELPSKLHERFTFSYGFFPLIKFLEINRYIQEKDEVIFKIYETINRNKSKIVNEAKNLSKRLVNKNVLAYGTNYFYPACYRMQTALSEDAKIFVHSNRITELYHNELEAFPNPHNLPIILIDKHENISYKNQLEYFKKIIKHYYEFEFYEFSREERMFLFFYFVDFLGYFLSKIHRSSMGKTPLSDKIKRK